MLTVPLRDKGKGVLGSTEGIENKADWILKIQNFRYK